ncbi:MAG TPA: hypothetical protein VFJ14_01720 [Nocardioidaceae bacterium]|nr:hypothetical protein [Nocardioidaceae bacterium]
MATTTSRPNWGPWVLDTDNWSLSHPLYDVDLDRCATAAEVRDWIAQLAGKTWVDDATLAGLIHALNDVLRLQATLCGNGQDHPALTKDDVTNLVAKAVARTR